MSKPFSQFSSPPGAVAVVRRDVRVPQITASSPKTNRLVSPFSILSIIGFDSQKSFNLSNNMNSVISGSSMVTPSVPNQSSVTGSAVYGDDQLKIIHFNAAMITSDAIAGAGETTTGPGYSKYRQGMKRLYHFLNTANKIEMAEKFKGLAEEKTVHRAENHRGQPRICGDRADPHATGTASPGATAGTGA
jgi:hypothetical protein